MRSLILLVLVAAAVAVPMGPQRIVGGEPTTIEQYPYMANMLLGWPGGATWSQRCGGSLITTRSILSSARCYYRTPPNNWRVQLGTTLTAAAVSEHEVRHLVVHREYDDEFEVHDVAIVYLSTAATLSSQIGVARVAGPNYILPAGTLVTTLGYGLTYESQGSSASQLQRVDVNLIDHDVCVQRYTYLQSQPGFSTFPSVTDGMICTGILDVGGKDACHRDYGGPVAHNGDVLIGIISWAYDCGDEFYPRVNTRVSAYTDWIIEHA